METKDKQKTVTLKVHGMTVGTKITAREGNHGKVDK